jgi:hypothetical protein
MNTDKIYTSSYRMPKSDEFFVYVWSHGKGDGHRTYSCRVSREDCVKRFPELTTEKAVHSIACDMFINFTNNDKKHSQR